VLTLVTALVLTLACSRSDDAERTDSVVISGAEATARSTNKSTTAAERARDSRPSVILVVLDTLRADAVSAYGEVEGTTPEIDRLAEQGVRYARAFAPAPWTAASHASLFTGLRVDEHGVGLDGVVVTPESMQMMAEDFQEAGYVTAGLAANAMLHDDFGFSQGFDLYGAPSLVANVKMVKSGQTPPPFGLLDRLTSWNRERDHSRPYFLFVNLFEAHDPYEVRDVNPWIPEDVPRSELDYVQSAYTVSEALCDSLPTARHLELLHGLYLGDVAAADAKLAEVLRIMGARDEASPPIVVVTSDHGEHLGENRLMGHRFSVRHAALRIPLVVTGLPDLRPAVIERPVELRDLHASLRCWALGDACEGALPLESGSSELAEAESRPIFSLYSDSVTSVPDFVREGLGIAKEDEPPMLARDGCQPNDPVYGEMVSLIRYPYKMTWFSDHEPVLHDLSWDPVEQSDQLERQPERAAKLREELDAFVEANVTNRESAGPSELTEEALRTLESLGYVE